MTKPETALSAVVERTFPLSEFGDDLHDYLQRGLRDVLYADLTALISEWYVEKEAYIALENTLAKTEAALLDAREATGYPVEFVEWLIKDQEIFFGELNEEYILNDNIHVGGRKLQTIDELFNYWKENEQ